MAGHINEGRRIIRDAELLAEAHEGLVTEWDNVPASLQAKIHQRRVTGKQDQL